jgi:hypothetical protein
VGRKFFLFLGGCLSAIHKQHRGYIS